MLEGLTHALKMLGVTKSVPAYQETPLNVTSNQESLLLRA
jgi:hypothetical protein